jgi:hypothetical protein
MDEAKYGAHEKDINAEEKRDLETAGEDVRCRVGRTT